MTKWTKIGIIGGAVILLAVLLYYFGFANSDEDYITDDWTMTYDPDLKEPYGTFVLKNLLDTTGLFGNFLELDAPLEETLEDNEDLNDIYFFLGQENYLKDSSSRFLLDFVYDGNTVVMIAEEFPEEFLAEFAFGTSETDVYEKVLVDTTQFVKFAHPNFQGKRYQFDFIYHNQVKDRSWHYFDRENFDDFWIDSLYELGSNTKNEPNFVKFQYGKGEIYLHSQPYLFTNICLMRRDGFQYAENFFRHVPPGRVQWDKYSLRYSSANSNSGSGNNSGGGGEDRESILQFIMNNPPLFWAFILLIVGGVLYAIFKGKRMQDIVPATESKENMSLQYINTLSSLYLKERKHTKLIRLKEKTFLNFIAEHYYIQSNTADEKFIHKVAVKSHVPEGEIREIFELFESLQKRYDVTDQELIELHQKIEHFYKTCR